ncbi:MAG: sigma-70 family RNA polymerase sigma factor [Acidimicrobiales bacterium]
MPNPAVVPDAAEFEAHRRALTGYCYRMLGSGFEAEDAVQETMVRAWQAADRFEGRASVKSWLFRIAHNVCIDMSRSSQRRALSVDLGPASPPDPALLADVRPAETWLSPIPDASVLDPGGDPAEVAALRDSVRLAFVSALQLLPARQRAALVLCEVLHWSAAEVAELLETSSASVNSALQRARASLAVRDQHPNGADLDPELLSRFVGAFERYDMDALGELFHNDVLQTMPPYAMWLQGRDDLLAWFVGPGAACEGSKLLATRANGRQAFAQYKPVPSGGYAPWALVVVESSNHLIGELHFFLDTDETFPRFGFPAHIDS